MPSEFSNSTYNFIFQCVVATALIVTIISNIPQSTWEGAQFVELATPGCLHRVARSLILPIGPTKDNSTHCLNSV